MHFPIKVVYYVIRTFSLCEQKIIEFEKKNTAKDKWKYCDVIQLLPLLGVNYCLPLLHMSKQFVYMNSTE